MKQCSHCGETRPLDEFGTFTRRDRGGRTYVKSWCRPCRTEAGRKYNRLRARSERQRENCRRWQHQNPEKVRAASKKWQQKAYHGARAAVFAHYGEACACCGSTENLTIDHVNGDGRVHRREVGPANFYRWLVSEGFPDGHQTLCRACNASKRAGPRCRLPGHVDGEVLNVR